MNADRAARLASLTTAHLADACIRVDVPVRCAPAGMRPLAAGSRVAGRVLPARHAGSVDVFLEAFEHAREGDVLVVDNGGRTRDWAASVQHGRDPDRTAGTGGAGLAGTHVCPRRRHARLWF